MEEWRRLQEVRKQCDLMKTEVTSTHVEGEAQDRADWKVKTP